MTFLRKIKTGIKMVHAFLWSKTIGCLHYDRKYMSGRWFDGILADGWKWMMTDYKGCKCLSVNLHVPWPVSPRIHVVHPENIIFDPHDLNNFQGFGNYFQAIEKIEIGKGTYIAPNVAIITANHNPFNLDEHLKGRPVNIGRNCWIGFHSVILPGIRLGDRTIVGAGSVVTHSFSEGNCVIGGNPAKIIKHLTE